MSALGKWLLSLLPPAPVKDRKHQPVLPAALPTDRPTLAVGNEDIVLDGGQGGPPPVITVPDETRPMHAQPVRFTQRPDGQPALAFTVDPQTGQAVRWIPPGTGGGASLDPGTLRRLRQAPGAPPPGQLPPRSVPVPPPTPLETQAERVETAREADRARAVQMLMQLRAAGMGQEEGDRHMDELIKTTNPGDTLRRLLEARNAR